MTSRLPWLEMQRSGSRESCVFTSHLSIYRDVLPWMRIHLHPQLHMTPVVLPLPLLQQKQKQQHQQRLLPHGFSQVELIANPLISSACYVNALVVHKETNEATDKHTDADPKADKHKGNLYIITFNLSTTTLTDVYRTSISFGK